MRRKGCAVEDSEVGILSSSVNYIESVRYLASSLDSSMISPSALKDLERTREGISWVGYWSLLESVKGREMPHYICDEVGLVVGLLQLRGNYRLEDKVPIGLVSGGNSDSQFSSWMVSGSFSILRLRLP